MKRFFSVAPMMKKTDKHFRFLCSHLSKKSFLFTEMIHCNAILRGDSSKLLSYHNCENPLSLQLGGSDPKDLGAATQIASKYNYEEINLNVGCPSKKVKSGNFGVFLMKDIPLLQKCIVEMKKNTSLPITIKCRVGVDKYEGEKFLDDFIERITDVGVTTYFIHARKAISGLDTKRNRSIPPLMYEKVYRIKDKFPDLEVILNGGISNANELDNHLKKVDGVMLGRKVYSDPSFLLSIDKNLYGEDTFCSIDNALKEYMNYILNLDNRKDSNRAINHLMQFIKSLSIEKNKRKEILEKLNNKNEELNSIFDDFTQGCQRNLSPNL